MSTTPDFRIGPTEREKMLICNMVDEGATLQQIADKLGIAVPASPSRDRAAYMRQWFKTKVGTSRNGKTVYLNAPYKRSKPDKCELCNRTTKYLGYHHWNDSNPSVGLWLCAHCHIFAEHVENSMIHVYQVAKRRAVKEVEGNITLINQMES